MYPHKTKFIDTHSVKVEQKRVRISTKFYYYNKYVSFFSHRKIYIGDLVRQFGMCSNLAS